MTEYQTTFLQLLSKALFKRDVEVEKTDWLEVLKEAQSQAVTQLVYSVLDKSLLTPEEAKQWKLASSATISDNIRVLHNHSLLHLWMTDANIPYVILKGAASASYYPIPSYRSMGDVDFLVKTEDLERAGKVLEEQGLTPWNEEHISHIVYRGPKMHYEMHFNLAGTPHGEAGDLVREYTVDIFEKATIKKIGVEEAVLPCPFHHGLILLLHTCHHLTGEGVGLRHLCDWAVFENGFSDQEFRDLFEEKLKALGLWRFAQILTRTSIKHLGAEEKEWAESDCAVVDNLMEDILISGNFGKKDNNRSIQAMVISERGKDGVGRTSMSRQFRKSANEIIGYHWPSAKNNKLLIPIGWLFFGIRRLIRELEGKRERTDVKRLVDGARQRRELYRQFHLYETE